MEEYNVNEIVEETAEEVVEEVTEETVEEVAEEAVAEVAPDITDIKSALAAIVAENGGEFPADAEKAALRFSELAPALVKEARLADVFFACGGSEDLCAVKNAKESEQRAAVKNVVEEMHREYWIDESAALMICADFLAAIGAEAAEEEETLCQLADRYYRGEGVPQDKEKAAELYNEAGNKGDVIAQYTLGYMYDKGDGIDKDRDKAILWYEKAAEQGHEAAQNRLAVLKRNQPQAQPASCGCEEEAPKKKGFFCRK